MPVQTSSIAPLLALAGADGTFKIEEWKSYYASDHYLPAAIGYLCAYATTPEAQAAARDENPEKSFREGAIDYLRRKKNREKVTPLIESYCAFVFGHREVAPANAPPLQPERPTPPPAPITEAMPPAAYNYPSQPTFDGAIDFKSLEYDARKTDADPPSVPSATQARALLSLLEWLAANVTKGENLAILGEKYNHKGKEFRRKFCDSSQSNYTRMQELGLFSNRGQVLSPSFLLTYTDPQHSAKLEKWRVGYRAYLRAEAGRHFEYEAHVPH